MPGAANPYSMSDRCIGAHAQLRLRTYLSSAVSLFTDEDLERLLEMSRTKNQKNQITGMLLYADGCFLQAFEGPVHAVESLHETISDDPRHRGVLDLLACDTTERIFERWSMGFQHATRDQVAKIDGLSDFLRTGFLEKPVDHRQVLTLLNSFRRTSLRAA
jgi:hypothetical protein